MDINVSLNRLKVKKSVVKATDFEKIEFDSRKVSAGDMFVAIVGTVSDGHDYIETAISAGAKIIVCERMPEKLHDGVSYVQVESSSEALGILASDYYGNPSSKLKLVGVTGTMKQMLMWQIFVRIGVLLKFSIFPIVMTIGLFLRQLPTKATYFYVGATEEMLKITARYQSIRILPFMRYLEF